MTHLERIKRDLERYLTLRDKQPLANVRRTERIELGALLDRAFDAGRAFERAEMRTHVMAALDKRT